MAKRILNKKERLWSWWLHRYIYYTGKIVRRGYVFKDIDGAEHIITDAQLEVLRERP